MTKNRIQIAAINPAPTAAKIINSCDSPSIDTFGTVIKKIKKK
jgi:hypothetical protein